MNRNFQFNFRPVGRVFRGLLLSIVIVSTALAQGGQTGGTVNNGRKIKVTKYETFIYTSDRLVVPQQDTRGFFNDLLTATVGAGKGIAGGYVGTLIDLGVNSVASLLTKNSTDKAKWEEIVKAENTYQEKIGTVENIHDFYSKSSLDGPMDPQGLKFNGIGCLRTLGADTVFYISTHIDQEKIGRIVNHSKFELSLDTLIIDPSRCDLPNSAFDTVFSFDRRKDFQMAVEVKFISSWINEMTQLQTNQELGTFSISIPVDPATLDANGKLRYVRSPGKPETYRIVGESFIVPRSYMGFRDENDKHHHSWGTGEYRIEVTLKESCNITQSYRKEWKSDLRRRQAQADSDDDNIPQRVWKMISSQRWDEISKQWVITTLKAPADMVTHEILDELNLTSATTTSAKPTSSGATKAGGQGKQK